jgi:hypothetical protein
MKFFRYRRPSLSTLLGITKAKKQVKKKLGITERSPRLQHSFTTYGQQHYIGHKS